MNVIRLPVQKRQIQKAPNQFWWLDGFAYGWAIGASIAIDISIAFFLIWGLV